MLVVAGAMIAVIAFLLSVLFVRDTAAHVALEQARDHAGADGAAPPLRRAFAQATYREPALRSCSQAGLVNNLNDALAWGLVPLYLAAHGASVGDIGLVAAIYPGVWSVAQIATGHWSDTRRTKAPDRRRHARAGSRAGLTRARQRRASLRRPPQPCCSAPAPRSSTRP